jgi:acyl carrier protein
LTIVSFVTIIVFTQCKISLGAVLDSADPRSIFYNNFEMTLSTADASVLASHIETAAYLAPGELNPGEHLFSAGIIDSMSLIELIAFTEQHFNLRVPAGDITLDNWDSLDRILAYIARRRSN